MSNELEIPLFPLNVVLFPDSKIPLYIFEERYKKMINESVDNNTFFGINYFADRKIHTTGCSATVHEIVSKSEGGEMNIITKGAQRYIVNTYKLSTGGFYIGNVEIIEEVNLEYDRAKMEKCVKIYNDLIELVYKGTIKKIDLSDVKWHDGKRSVAFSIAEKCGLSLMERQNLLEIDTENIRLDFILKYFDKVMPEIKETDRISTIIKSDGYIQ